MKKAVRSKSLLSLSILIAYFISLMPCAGLTTASKASSPLVVQARSLPRPVSGRRDFINYRNEGAVGCRDASEEESQVMRRRTDRTTHVISPNRATRSQLLSAESAGLQIVLRGTNQLENFPAAKAAFLNAAARWEALVSSPITVVIDVDFGTTWFGESFDDNVLGQTSSQVLGDNSIYGEVRDSLSELGPQDARAAIYSRLPQTTVPTALGATSDQNFGTGARLFLKGERQKKTANDATNPTTVLMARKAGKLIEPGQTVTLQVRNSDGTDSNELLFTRPIG